MTRQRNFLGRKQVIVSGENKGKAVKTGTLQKKGSCLFVIKKWAVGDCSVSEVYEIYQSFSI
jgi:hypothetical protein